jgi:hypothetical protein
VKNLWSLRLAALWASGRRHASHAVSDFHIQKFPRRGFQAIQAENSSNPCNDQTMMAVSQDFQLEPGGEERGKKKIEAPSESEEKFNSQRALCIRKRGSEPGIQPKRAWHFLPHHRECALSACRPSLAVDSQYRLYSLNRCCRCAGIEVEFLMSVSSFLLGLRAHARA